MILTAIAVTLFILTDSYARQRCRSCQTTISVSNLRQVGFALFEFETEYGRFPDASTIPEVEKKNPKNSVPLGAATANECFRQLFAADIAISESMFHSPTPRNRRPDNFFGGNKTLEKSECSYAFIAGLSSTKNLPDTPLAVFPLLPGTLLFDKDLKHHGGKATILRVDNSVITLPVDKSGHVYLNGKDLFDPSQPFWGGKLPDVKWPE